MVCLGFEPEAAGRRRQNHGAMVATWYSIVIMICFEALVVLFSLEDVINKFTSYYIHRQFRLPDNYFTSN